MRVPRSAHALLAVTVMLGLAVSSTARAAASVPPGDQLIAAGKPDGGGNPKTSRGFDISYPQCGSAYPANPAFGIVGVNGGKVFSANSCLTSQIAWGGNAAAQLYANTGNPGPALSSFWPNGQTTPRACSATNNDTADCAYDYGWNAAQDSFNRALGAYQALGLTTSPSATAWWLDVETANSWRGDTALNVAALQGGYDYLRAAGVAVVGFYSTTVQWGTITGPTTVFSSAPSWGAGSPSQKVAQQHCGSTPGFTGGPLTLAQYPYSGFDADLRC